MFCLRVRMGVKRCVWSGQAFLCVLLAARVLLPSHVGVISSKILEVSRQKGAIWKVSNKEGETVEERGGAVPTEALPDLMTVKDLYIVMDTLSLYFYEISENSQGTHKK